MAIKTGNYCAFYVTHFGSDSNLAAHGIKDFVYYNMLRAWKGKDLEVRIADLFDVNAATMISSNTIFETDVASGKIAVDSLQGQFTAKYYTGSQGELEKVVKATKSFPMNLLLGWITSKV